MKHHNKWQNDQFVSKEPKNINCFFIWKDSVLPAKQTSEKE